MEVSLGNSLVVWLCGDKAASFGCCYCFVVSWSCFSSYFDKFAKLEFMQICILTFQPSFGELMQYFSYQKK
jgi:hypothetical protein